MKKAILAVGVMALAACSDATTPGSSTVNIRPLAVISATGTEVVTEADVTRAVEGAPATNSWMLYIRAADPTKNRTGTGSGTFVLGPDEPPLGVGSFESVTPDLSSKVYLFNYDHINTALLSITGISYQTFRTSPVTGGVVFPALNMQIDINGGALNTKEFRTLVFEPYVQSGFVNNSGVWESRDAYAGGAGKWWSTQDTANSNPSTGTGGARGCGQATPCTWTAILAAFPGATITSGFGINQGSGNPGVNGSSDALSISYGGNTVTYDFEVYVTASSKDDCKNGGWVNVKRADGSAFKNQGDCVSYLNNI